MSPDAFVVASGYQKIVSRTGETGRYLARSCDASWSSVYDFSDSEDLIIVAVPDDKLPEILSRIKCPDNTVVAHTAGSLGLDLFPAFPKACRCFLSFTDLLRKP